MTFQTLVVWIFTGVVAGWLASEAVRGKSFGFVGNVVVGIIGACLAGLWAPRLGFHYGPPLLMEIINAAIGGIVLLLVLSLLQRVLKGK